MAGQYGGNHRSQLEGILANDMGLGKTLRMIFLVLQN